jgi:hypothetical protein
MRLSYGARIGPAFSLTALRRRNVLPWAGLAMGYENYFESGGRQPTHFLRDGFRIGLPWTPENLARTFLGRPSSGAQLGAAATTETGPP